MSPHSRQRRMEATQILKQAQGKGIHTTFCDLLEEELTAARDDLENAHDAVTVWRAQGRAAALRQILSSITTQN